MEIIRKTNGEFSSIKIVQYTIEGHLMRIWNSTKEAEETLNLTGITHCLKGKTKSTGKFIWRYCSDFENNNPATTITIEKIKEKWASKKRPIAQYTIEGKFICLHDSMRDAAQSIGDTRENVKRCCNKKSFTAKGFIFRRVSDFGTEAPETISVEFLKNRQKNKFKRIFQYDKEGKLIGEYINAKQVSEIYNVSEDTIRDCCNEKLNSVRGFVWRYDE